MVAESRREWPGHVGSLITARFDGSAEMSISGTVIGGEPRLVGLDALRLDAVLQGRMLVDLHHDRPGIVGNMGRLLGQENINIAFAQMSRDSHGGTSIMVLGLDEQVPPTLMGRFLEVPGLQRVRMVSLPSIDGYYSS